MPEAVVIRVTRQSIVVLLLAIVLIWLLLHLTGILVVLFMAVLLAIAVAPLAARLAAAGVPRGLAILLIYLAVLGVFSLAVALLVPLVSDEVNQFQKAVPGYIALLDRYHLRVPTSLTGPELQSRLGDIAARVGAVALKAVDVVTTALVTIVISFFMTVDDRFAERVITRLIPWRYQPRVAAVAGVIGSQLGHWLRAQILIAFIFGLAMAIGLALMGVPYAATIGLFGALVEVIPYVGGIMTVALASLVALSVHPWLVLAVLALYIVLSQVEAHVLFPALMGRAVGLHPLLVVLALFVGARLFGILGALLAVPVAVIIQVLIDELYANKPPHPAAEAQIERAEQP